MPYLELVLIWNIFDRYTIVGSSTYIVQVLLKVILQGFKVNKLTVTKKKNFDAAVAVAATAVFGAATICENYTVSTVGSSGALPPPIEDTCSFLPFSQIKTYIKV